MNRPSIQWLVVGASIAILLLVVNVALTIHNIRQLNEDVGWVAHTHEVIGALTELLSLAKDAETGHRGYIITGEKPYRAPYDQATAAILGQVDSLEKLLRDNPDQLARLPELRKRIDAKLAEMDSSLALRDAQGFEAAREYIANDRGKKAMDAYEFIRGGVMQTGTVLI